MHVTLQAVLLKIAEQLAQLSSHLITPLCTVKLKTCVICTKFRSDFYRSISKFPCDGPVVDTPAV